MSKLTLKVVGGTLLAFIILSLIQFHRGPKFTCVPGYGGSAYQIQDGFPFVFLKRSVDQYTCLFANGAETGTQADYYSVHHIQLLNLAGDVILWGDLAVGLLLVLKHRRSTP